MKKENLAKGMFITKNHIVYKVNGIFEDHINIQTLIHKITIGISNESLDVYRPAHWTDGIRL